MPILKKRQIETIEQMNGEELEWFLESLPVEKQQLEDLFDYLHVQLAKAQCDHTLGHSMRFMMTRLMPFPKVTGWLNDNGGYCDCKVLENIETEWLKVFGTE